MSPGARTARLTLVVLALAAGGAHAWPRASPQAEAGPAAGAIDTAMHAMYNADFAAANRAIDALLAADPRDPLTYATRAAALLHAEYDRLEILKLAFFESDDRLTDGDRLKPEPAVRAKILESTEAVRRLAAERLASDPSDRRALFALSMGIGVETHYTRLVEKRYVRSSSLTTEIQSLAEQMVALDPPVYDAYLTLGSIEYAVSCLNPIVRLLARMRGLRSGKDEALEHLQLVAAKGRYYRPYAKILLSVLHLREGRLHEARTLLGKLRAEFPSNPLYARELARLDRRIAAARR